MAESENFRHVGTPGALNPDVQAYLERVRSLKLPSVTEVAPAMARAAYRASSSSVTPAAPEVASVQNLKIPGPHGEIALRIYRPLGSPEQERCPALIYFHGGGWTIGDLDSHDVICRELANRTPCVVVSVDYRLAPENKFPIPLGDCRAATDWLFKHASEYGIDRHRIAIGGDSAGANLAAVISLELRDLRRAAGGAAEQKPQLVFQLLIYPATDQRCDTASHLKFGKGFALTHEMILYFRGNYLRPDQWEDWQASPLLAKDHSDLPPALMITAGHDPLVDEGLAYAKKLQDSGSFVSSTCYEEMIHGFLRLGKVIPKADIAVQECVTALAKYLTQGDSK